MLLPTKADFGRKHHHGISFWGAYLHPNRRPYKYFWQVYTADSPWEGAQFFEKAPPLCTAAFMELRRQLVRTGTSAYVYNGKRPRVGHGLPIDLDHPRWKDCQWAPSWEDDPDPEWEGHK